MRNEKMWSVLGDKGIEQAADLSKSVSSDIKGLVTSFRRHGIEPVVYCIEGSAYWIFISKKDDAKLVKLLSRINALESLRPRESQIKWALIPQLGTEEDFLIPRAVYQEKLWEGHLLAAARILAEFLQIMPVDPGDGGAKNTNGGQNTNKSSK